ncbi:MAG TPA: hypothetical protein VLS93_12815 [Anaeromyxobacteraceae bacterium]|nr:hypothetical protein [Anaeromyxobacteraceae bacterium]
MDKKRLPRLADTGRRYVEDTVRARLSGPGIERYPPRRRRAAALLLAAAGLLALLAAFFWMARGS